MKDINGTEIKAGDTVEVTINLPYQEPVKFLRDIIQVGAGIKFNDKVGGSHGSITEMPHNVDLRVVG